MKLLFLVIQFILKFKFNKAVIIGRVDVIKINSNNFTYLRFDDVFPRAAMSLMAGACVVISAGSMSTVE